MANLSQRPQNLNFAQRSTVINNQLKYNREQEYLKNPNKCGNMECINPNLTYEQRHYKHCSKSCSAIVSNAKRSYDFITPKFKQKVSNGLKSYYVDNPNSKNYFKIPDIIICKNCKEPFIQKNTEKHCSDVCLKNKQIEHGKKIASKRCIRSNNEIELANLCINNFKNVTTNEQFFNGWDADILIHDIKLAILWCGDWHYREMYGNHSLKQVENRDNYKTKQILKKGWSVCFIREYTTKNPNVERAFQSLIDIIKDIDNTAFTLYLPKIKK